MIILRRPSKILLCTFELPRRCLPPTSYFKLRSVSEALIKGLKMAVDLGEWRNRNGIRAQLDFAQMEWEFIEGVMEVC